MRSVTLKAYIHYFSQTTRKEKKMDEWKLRVLVKKCIQIWYGSRSVHSEENKINPIKNLHTVVYSRSLEKLIHFQTFFFPHNVYCWKWSIKNFMALRSELKNVYFSMGIIYIAVCWPCLSTKTEWALGIMKTSQIRVA